MDAKRRSFQILGWLSVIPGFGLGLLLIRGIFIGTTRGFGAARSQAFWISCSESPAVLSASYQRSLVEA